MSGIENDKVNAPSIKIVKKLAKLFGQDARALAGLAWQGKAPSILKAAGPAAGAPAPLGGGRCSK